MNAHQDLEAKVRARGVRVEERLAILARLQLFEGGDQLAELLEEHERAIEEAAKKVQTAIR